MTVTYEFISSSGNLTLDESDLIWHTPVLVHTGKGDLEARFSLNRDLDEYAQRQNRVNVKLDGVTKWTGFILAVEHSEKDGVSRIQCDGIAKKLEENRPSSTVTYSSIALDEAIADYWGKTSFSATVTDQNTSVVSNDADLQDADTNSEWTNVTNLSDTDQFFIDSGKLKLAQSGFFFEGENPDSSSGAGFFTDLSNASEGEHVELANDGDSVSYNFTLDYTIPAADVAVALRQQLEDVNEVPGINILIDNTTLFDSNGTNWTNTGENGWEWFDQIGFSSDLTSGSHTVKVEVDAATTNTKAIHFDVVFAYDDRNTYTFDNTTDSDDHLSGPEPFPEAQTTELVTKKTQYNIESATTDLTINDTSNGQAVALSNDGGSTYTTQNNTSSATVNFSSAGRTFRQKFTLDGFGSRTTDSPTTRFNGQEIDLFDTNGDLNDLVVIDELDLSRSHFSNLQTLHDYGDFLWVIEHDSSDIGNLTVTSFQRGDESRSRPSEWDSPINKAGEIQGGNYYNKIYLEGALDDQGNRPSAEVSDSTAISNDDRTISPGVLRDTDITTEDGALFRARALLQTALSNNDYVGSITVPPVVVNPGYSRSVDLSGDGTQQDKTVERVRLTQAQGELQATFEFSVREDFSQDISNLKRQARNLEDQV